MKENKDSCGPIWVQTNRYELLQQLFCRSKAMPYSRGSSGSSSKISAPKQFVPSKETRSDQKKKSDISVSPPFKKDKDQLIKIGEVVSDTILVVNNGTSPEKLLKVKLIYVKPYGAFSLSTLQPSTDPRTVCKGEAETQLQGPWILDPSCPFRLNVSCHGLQASIHKATLLCQFEECVISCHVALMGEDTYSKDSAPREPYKGRSPRLPPARKIVRGQPPPSLQISRVLPQYAVPRWVAFKKKTLPTFRQELSLSNYVEFFSMLLYVEELQMQEDIRAYDQQNVQMSIVHGDLLALKVTGLSEKRPSLVYRDMVYARYTNTANLEYQGFICSVLADEIHVKFGRSFFKAFVSNLRFDIRFSFGRINMRRAHDAVYHSKRLNNILFPKFTSEKQCRNEQRHFAPFNRVINLEQTTAVANIMNKSGGSPYIILGPPGTGKTVTLVEAILQIHRSDPKAVILACAPSNGASDLILERLVGIIQERDILRLNAYTRPITDVPSHLLPYCSAENSDIFSCPNMKELMRYKLIISTYLSSGLLDAQGIPCGHFSHIFLDEAGQATEPDSLIPIANLATSETVIVLAGDPQQLGPVIRSPIARKFGLEKSLLERLITFPLYSHVQNGDSKYIIKLVKNYRSHPDILDLPSKLFYSGELVSCADNSVYSLCDWDEVQNQKFPLLFFGLEGSNKREGSSPSWFNPQEVSKVMEMVKKLKEFKASRVSNNDIGIIAPYSQQVKKIKNALAAANLGDIKVGSVEQFQGQEKRVIIISTVRTSTEFLDFDKEHDIGFLSNPKRFNVAITRAKALLIVIGNPYVLYKDKHWGALISYCIANKAYRGCSTPKENEDEMRDIINQIGKK